MSDSNDKRLIESKKMIENRNKWTSTVKLLSEKLKLDVKDVIELQSEAISYRQIVVEEINIYSVKILKLVQKIKVLYKDRFEFYAQEYQIKTVSSEKVRLIDSDMSENQSFIDEMDQHVNFLRENASMNKCSIFKYISNEEDFKISANVRWTSNARSMWYDEL